MFTIEDLKARKEELEKELELINGLIALRTGEAQEVKRENGNIKISSGSSTIRGRVVDATIELIHKKGRQVNNKEILDYIEEKGLSLGSAKRKSTALGAILSQECDKKSARLKRVTFGVYDVK